LKSLQNKKACNGFVTCYFSGVGNANTGDSQMFIVIVDHNGETWPLKGTVWAFSMDRAQKFETREAAQAQLDKAKKFMKPALAKKARIVEATV